MDRAKKARTPVRTRVTKVCRAIEAEVDTGVPSKETLLDLLTKLLDAQKRLRECDAAVMEAMLDEDKSDDDIQMEDDECEERQDMIRAAIRIVEYATQPKVSEKTATKGDEDSKAQSHKTFKLPKVELKKFSGELKEWLGWWAQFKKIDEDAALHASDKFQYLVQSMTPGSRAAELVSSFPMSEENYPKVISALKERFGKPELLQEVYVRELLKMVTQNAANPKGKEKLSSMYDKLEAHLRALSSLGISGANMSVFLHPMIESSLPEHLLVAWQRSANYSKDGSQETPPKSRYDYLMDFLRTEVENEAKRSLVSSFDSEKTQEQEKKRGSSPVKKKKQEFPTAASLVSTEEGGCCFCGKRHPSTECFKAREMPLEEKLQILMKSRRCFLCFKCGHPSKTCKAFVKCLVCGQRHQTVMCAQKLEDSQAGAAQNVNQVQDSLSEVSDQNLSEDSQTGAFFNRGTGPQQVLLKTLRVNIVSPDGRNRMVRLLFDEGSQRSYIKESLAKELACKKVGEETYATWLFGGVQKDKRTRSTFNVILESTRGSNKQYRNQFLLTSEPVLCQNVPTPPIGPWMRELIKKKVALTDSYADNAEIEVLIGSDYRDLLMTGKIEKTSCELVATETLLGWTLSGPFGGRSKENLAFTTISMMNCEERSVSDIWSPETLGIQDPIKVKGEEQRDIAAELQSQKLFVEENKDVAQKLRVSLFVDNAVSSFAREEDFEDYKERSVRILDDAKMQWEWEQSREGVTNVLGLRGDKMQGELFCVVKKKSFEKKLTRRGILSAIHKLYDPVGFTCPVTLQPKRLLRELQKQFSWDGESPEEVVNRFKKWNPADLPSRGCNPRDLVASRWWEGPTWLKSKSDWSTSSEPADDVQEVQNQKYAIQKLKKVKKREVREPEEEEEQVPEVKTRSGRKIGQPVRSGIGVIS